MDENTIVEIRKCSNAEFVGFLNKNEILSFLANAKVLINTSHFEGFSNTFLESFSVGTPIILMENVDPDNIINKNKLGKVVRSQEEFPNKIQSFIDDESEYNRLIANYQEYLINNHNPKKIVKDLILKLDSHLSNN